DYSVLPPWLFPHHPGAIKDEKEPNSFAGRGLATIREWQQFDYKAGWGLDEFESHIPAGFKFPPRWRDEYDRRVARQIII
ncbi:hypothetical protein ACQ7B2_32155, partial [Escherichia coli]